MKSNFSIIDKVPSERGAIVLAGGYLQPEVGVKKQILFERSELICFSQQRQCRSPRALAQTLLLLLPSSKSKPAAAKAPTAVDAKRKTLLKKARSQPGEKTLAPIATEILLKFA